MILTPVMSPIMSDILSPIMFSQVNIPSITQRYFTDFDSTAQNYIGLGSDVVLTGDCRFGAKFAATDVATIMTLMGESGDTNNLFYVESGGNIRLRINGGDYNDFGLSPVNLFDGKLHRLYAERNDGVISAYIDGQQLPNTIANNDNITFSALGVRDVALYWNGILLDSFCQGGHIYNLRNLTKKGYEAGSGYTYIVAGDSTRDASFTHAQSYYTQQLSKINYLYVDNARSGQDSTEWVNDTYAPVDGITAAINATSGTGESTILEFSFGINDSGTGEQVKAALNNAISAYLTAKPDATILLVTPVATSDTGKTATLKRVYEELSVELGLVLIDVQKITSTLVGNSSYYYDNTHPNRAGTARVINYILNDVAHSDIVDLLTLEDITDGEIITQQFINSGVDFTQSSDYLLDMPIDEQLSGSQTAVLDKSPSANNGTFFNGSASSSELFTFYEQGFWLGENGTILELPESTAIFSSDDMLLESSDNIILEAANG